MFQDHLFSLQSHRCSIPKGCRSKGFIGSVGAQSPTCWSSSMGGGVQGQNDKDTRNPAGPDEGKTLKVEEAPATFDSLPCQRAHLNDFGSGANCTPWRE